MFSSTLNLKITINPLLDNQIHGRDFRGSTISCSLNTSQDLIVKKVRERVKGNVEISPSAYDTAWVAMVPERESSSRKPRFPECLDWIIENQNSDGSWGVQSSSMLKHSLSCTLACLLPLRKWNVASPQLIRNGMEFIKSSASAARDKDQITPIGFDIIFPMMIQYANDLNLELPLDQDFVRILFRNREALLTRNKNLEYVAEGLGNSIDWNKLLSMHQRSNGSLFNSPATTAAALLHRHDEKCLEYLNSLLCVNKTWVPTIHPVDVYSRLCLVDQLQGLGVDRFVYPEIETVLQETFRLWEQKDEEIFGDAACGAIAFRLLRLQGYPVAPDDLIAYVDRESSLFATDTVLELYKASQARLPQDDDDTLENLHHWTSNFLNHQLHTKTILDQHLETKVEFNLKNYRGIVDAVKHRRNLDLYDIDHLRSLKTAYRCPTVYNEDIFLLSAQDVMASQAQIQKELQMLERWYYNDCRLDDMDFGRNVLRVSHFLSANMVCDPQLFESRLAFAKMVTLVTRLDDFFDHHGSIQESLLIIELIREWKEPSTITYPSQEVEILYSAVYTSTTDMAEKAYPVQGRCIKSVLIYLWIDILTCFKSEMESCTAETPPDLDEYMAFAAPSIGVKICVLAFIHFLGVKISEEMVMGEECTKLWENAASVARLLNDLQTFKKERDERKINSVIILLNSGKLSEEEAVSNILKMIEQHRKELLKLVVEREGSVFPRKIRDAFWRSCNISFYLYSFTDEFTLPLQMKQDMKLLLHDPPRLHSSIHAT